MQLVDTPMKLARASALVQHLRPKLDEHGVPMPGRILEDGTPDLDTFDVVDEETVYNVITTVGRDFIHTQSYGTSAAANGLNWIALSNDTLTETSASTTLSTEIAANGLARAQGTVTHTVGATTTTVAKTFTCATAAQAAQKAALFTASTAGTMNHALAFTQRSLQVGDTLAVTFTITIS
jgi:hypothetical protein